MAEYMKCRINGCTTTVHAHYHCKPHLLELKKTGAVLVMKQVAPLKRTKMIKPPCEIVGCVNISAVRSLCKAHYFQMYKFGKITSIMTRDPVLRTKRD